MENYSLEITEKFLNRYNDLDRLRDKEEYKSFINYYYEDVENFRKIRNLAVHATIKGNKPFLVSESLLKQLEDLLAKVEVKAIDKSTKQNNIVFANLNDSISKIIKLMNDKNYSHIPILNEKKCLLGIITEKSIVSLISHDYGDLLDDSCLKVKDIIDELTLENNINEYFIFVSRKELLETVKTKSMNFKNGKRFGAAFVTENGLKEETILGMITLWDLR